MMQDEGRPRPLAAKTIDEGRWMRAKSWTAKMTEEYMDKRPGFTEGSAYYCKVINELKLKNIDLRSEMYKMIGKFDEEKTIFEKKLQEMEKKFNQAEIKQKNAERELAERKEDFDILMKKQMNKIEDVKTTMLDGIESVSVKMKEKEAQWRSKFKVLQSELAARMKNNLEKERKKHIEDADGALDEVGFIVRERLKDIKMKLADSSEEQIVEKTAGKE